MKDAKKSVNFEDGQQWNEPTAKSQNFELSKSQNGDSDNCTRSGYDIDAEAICGVAIFKEICQKAAEKCVILFKFSHH
jgi:hypothetical protein